MQSQTKIFDVAVLGGGPGGYPAAIKAAQLGKKVALIEAKELGGTCLNRGCIPSKALIANAAIFNKIKEAEEYGIHVEGVTIDYSKMVQRKDGVVSHVRKSLEGLIASNQITLIRGYGKLVSPKKIKVTGSDNLFVEADKIILATGSEPRNIPAFPIDNKKILDSTALLNLNKLPKSIAIIGGGIIGCEFASLFAAFGVEVTIFEMLPRILPTESEGSSQALARAFTKKGIKILTNAAVQKIDTNGEGVTVHLEDGQLLYRPRVEDSHLIDADRDADFGYLSEGNIHANISEGKDSKDAREMYQGNGKVQLEVGIHADLALVAVGRTLNTSNIGLENAGVLVNPDGIIPVNDKMETNVPGIYAIGDISSKWWLAHVATHQGLVAAKNASGYNSHMHYNAIPSVIFTEPEVASVGLTLEQAQKEGYQATVGAFPFQALGKSQATMETEGFAQVVTDKKTGQILGAQVVGHDAGTLIGEMSVAVANELTLESISESIHAHPTVAEAWLEAVLVANGTPLHLPPKKKG